MCNVYIIYIYIHTNIYIHTRMLCKLCICTYRHVYIYIYIHASVESLDLFSACLGGACIGLQMNMGPLLSAMRDGLNGGTVLYTVGQKYLASGNHLPGWKIHLSLVR